MSLNANEEMLAGIADANNSYSDSDRDAGYPDADTDTT